MEIKIPRKFEPLFKGDYDKYRVIVYYGGRGGGKSITLSYFAILKCLKARVRFYIVRQVEKSKGNSIHSLIKRLIREKALLDYIESTSIDKITFINGSEILFDGVSERTIDNIRSADNVKYFWFEEAHNLKEELMQVLIPSIRADDSQILISLNPQKSTDYIYTEYINNKNTDDDYSIAIKVNYNDNPFFPDVLERDRLRALNTLPRDVYLHLWEGETNDYNDLQVINIDRIGRFDDKQHYEYQTLILSIDTATSTRTGADYSVIAVLGATSNNEYHLIHLARGHWDWHTLMTKILDIYQIAYNITQQSPQHILIEAKANGNNVIQEIERTTSLNVIPITPMTDKLSRVIDNILPFIDSFKIPIDTTNPFNFWINDYLRELKMFRADGKHEHDDMIDATSQGLGYLASNNIDFATIAETFSKFRKDTY